MTSTATYKLGDIASVIRGVSFDKSEVQDSPTDDTLPILRAGNIGDELDTQSDLVWVPTKRVKDEQKLRRGDIPICMSSGSQAVVGKSAVLQTPWHGSVGAFCAIVRAKPDIVLPEFLAFYMRSGGFRSWTRTSEGANIKNIRHSELLAHRIPVPPITEQRRIVDILSLADNIVRMRREAEAKAKEIIPALFLDMFGDPATNAKRWPVHPAAQIIRSAEYGTSVRGNSEGSGIAMIRMANVDVTGRLDLDELKYVELNERDRSKYRLGIGDILFNRTNSKDLVGKTGIWRGECDAVPASYFIRVRVDTELTEPDYFWAFMNCRHMKQVLFSTARGAIGQSNINAEELRALPIPLPPIKFQRRFAVYVNQTLELEKQQSVATKQAAETCQSVMAGIFGQD